MRLKDERKPEAITKTIIKLINNIGFANISMSKIAKETGLSPATLYIYYESKDDMLRKTYMSIKRQMSQECLSNINISDDIKDIVFQLCRNLLAYMETHADEFLFLEQSANSPLVTDDMIQEFQIGLSFQGNQLRDFLEKKGILKTKMLELGLVNQKNQE